MFCGQPHERHCGVGIAGCLGKLDEYRRLATVVFRILHGVPQPLTVLEYGQRNAAMQSGNMLDMQIRQVCSYSIGASLGSQRGPAGMEMGQYLPQHISPIDS